MGLFVFVLDGIEFPGPRGAVCFAIGAYVVCGFKFGFQLSFCFGSSVVLCHIRIGKGKDVGVVFLTRRLILLVGFFAVAIELFAMLDVKVTRVGTFEFAVNEINC